MTARRDHARGAVGLRAATGSAARARRPRHGDAVAPQAGAGERRESLYADVTARIVAELEAGRFPWAQPWDSAKAGLGLPANAATGRPYSGINILILWRAAIEQGCAQQRWLTFRQALAAGGSVRKGARGVTVCYADRFTPKQRGDDPAPDSSAGAHGEASGRARGTVPFLKRFTLFSVAQCDGLPEAFTAPGVPLGPVEPVPVAEALIAATGADFRIGSPHAYYAPGLDFVAVPPQQAFAQPIDYYRIALHELGHWTGHRTRLDRDQTGVFGSSAYAREELVAELSAAFTCAALGIQPTVRHADYLASWLDVLRSDNRAIFKAASLASKASDFLLAFRAPVDRPGSTA